MRAKSLIKPSLLTASALISAPAIVHMAAYANTLTRLIPDLYAGLDVVSRELVGYIPSVVRDVSAERAAVGQSIVYFVTPQQGMVDVTPAMSIPEPPDNTIGNGTISITKSKAVPFGFTGEEQRGLNTGSGYLSVQADLFAQALRTLTNAIEVDLAAEAAANVSRWWGTAGTTPFASTVGDAAQVRKILDDNGAPLTGRALIVDTTAGANLRSLTNLTKANEAGTQMVLTDGTLINLAGLNIKESAGVPLIGAGTAAGSTTTAAGFAKGTTVIPIAAAGSGTIPAGTSIKFAGDNNVYTVAPGGGLASAAAGGSITLNAPGLRVAIPASATAITVVAAHVGSTAFSPNALRLVARAPALPNEGDLAIDRINITDPRSGMVFEVAIYAGYRKIRAEVAQAWGVKAIKPEHIAGLLG
jgi:hypothetical protein